MKKSGRKCKRKFYTPATARLIHTSRRKTPQSLDLHGLAHGDFSAPLRVKTPTYIASQKTGEGGVLVVRQDGSGTSGSPFLFSALF